MTHAFVLLAYLLLTLLMTWPLATQFNSAIPGDAFDGWQNYWNLWWLKVALVDSGHNPYFTDLLFAPTGVTLYFHTLNPLNGLITMPIQLGSGLIVAYNSVVVVSWVLAGYGTWLLTRWTIGRAMPRVGVGKDASRVASAADLAAFVAGAIFTFAPVHMAHLLGHMQVMALQWLPFYALGLLRGTHNAMHGRRWLHDGFIAGLFLSFAGLCDWYFVLYLFFFTAIVLLWVWLRLIVQKEWRWQVWIESVATAVVAGVVFAILLSPLLLPMIYEATHYDFMVRPSSDLYIFSATLLDFLLPNRMQTFFRPESFGELGNQVAPLSERTLAIGYGAIVLAGVALVAMGRRVAIWGVAALFFLLLALGPAMHAIRITAADIPAVTQAASEIAAWTPYEIANRLVPFMRISRSVSRFAIMVQLCMSVLAGAGLAWLMMKVNRAGAFGLAAIALILVMAESWVVPYPISPPDTPSYYESLAERPGQGAVLNLPMNYDRPGYLLFQTVHHRPLTVAYISRDDPRTMTERVPVLQHLRHLGPDIIDVDPAVVGMSVLADLGVEEVILDRYKMPGGEEREYTEAVAHAIFEGIAPTYADDRITVYPVVTPEVPQGYLELGPLHWGALQEQGDKQFRSVGPDNADLKLHHVDEGAQVLIEYQSDLDAVVRGDDGESWQLPASPDGAEVTINVAPGVERMTFVLPNGEVKIRRLKLLTDSETSQ